MAAARANREAQAELTLPHRVARLHHHGHVGAGDQQHQPDQAHENPHRLAVLIVIAANAARGHKLQQRLPLFGIECADGLLDDLGIGAGDRLLRLHRRNAGPQPRHHAQAPPFWRTVERVVAGGRAPCVQFRAILQRNPEVGGSGRFDALESVRRNAHHRHGNAS
jgi:hypothetical protein